MRWQQQQQVLAATRRRRPGRGRGHGHGHGHGPGHGHAPPSPRGAGVELRAVCRSSGVIALPAVTTGVQRGLCGRRSVPEPSLPLANIAVYLRLLALSSGPDRRVHIPQQPGDKARLRT